MTNLDKFSVVVLVVAFALIGILLFCGPFYNAFCPDAPAGVSVDYMAGDGRMVTRVGSYDGQGRVFSSTNKEGFLVYGPYLMLAPGRYSVTWRGTIRAESAPNFEIFSESAGVLSASKELIRPSRKDEYLKEIRFDLPGRIDDIQFRVLVNAADDLDISSVRLSVLECGNQ